MSGKQYAGVRPLFTRAQREDIAAALKARRDKRDEIDAALKAWRESRVKVAVLRAELAAMPGVEKLSKKYGATPAGLRGMVCRAYKREHVLDEQAAEKRV